MQWRRCGESQREEKTNEQPRRSNTLKLCFLLILLKKLGKNCKAQYLVECAFTDQQLHLNRL